MELKFILESLLFSAQKPMSVKELRDVLASAATGEDADAAARPFKKIKEDDLTAALEELAREHEAAARSYRLACVAGAWQFVTQPEFSPWLKALVGVKARPSRLSQAALASTSRSSFTLIGFWAENKSDSRMNLSSMLKLTNRFSYIHNRKSSCIGCHL